MSANMSEIDISILTISFMMSAVDGHVDQSEYDCFMELARHMDGFSEEQALAALDEAEHSAGYLELIARKNVSEDMFLSAFMKEAEHALDMRDVATFWDNAAACRAFLFWIAMAMADKEFSDIERKALELLRQHINWKMKHPLGRMMLMRYSLLDRTQEFEISPAFMQRIESMLLSLGEAAESQKKARCNGRKEQADALFAYRLQELKNYIEAYSAC